MAWLDAEHPILNCSCLFLRGTLKNQKLYKVLPARLTPDDFSAPEVSHPRFSVLHISAVVSLPKSPKFRILHRRFRPSDDEIFTLKAAFSGCTGAARPMHKVLLAANARGWKRQHVWEWARLQSMITMAAPATFGQKCTARESMQWQLVFHQREAPWALQSINDIRLCVTVNIAGISCMSPPPVETKMRFLSACIRRIQMSTATTSIVLPRLGSPDRCISSRMYRMTARCKWLARTYVHIERRSYTWEGKRKTAQYVPYL